MLSHPAPNNRGVLPLAPIGMSTVIGVFALLCVYNEVILHKAMESRTRESCIVTASRNSCEIDCEHGFLTCG